MSESQTVCFLIHSVHVSTFTQVFVRSFQCVGIREFNPWFLYFSFYILLIFQ